MPWDCVKNTVDEQGMLLALIADDHIQSVHLLAFVFDVKDRVCIDFHTLRSSRRATWCLLWALMLSNFSLTAALSSYDKSFFKLICFMVPTMSAKNQPK